MLGCCPRFGWRKWGKNWWKHKKNRSAYSQFSFSVNHVWGFLYVCVCFVGTVQENHLPDIGLYYKPITWHPVIRLYTVLALCMDVKRSCWIHCMLYIVLILMKVYVDFSRAHLWTWNGSFKKRTLINVINLFDLNKYWCSGKSFVLLYFQIHNHDSKAFC